MLWKRMTVYERSPHVQRQTNFFLPRNTRVVSLFTFYLQNIISNSQILKLYIIILQ